MSLDVQSRPAALDGDESDQGKGRDSDRRYQQSENVVTDGKCPEYGRGDGRSVTGVYVYRGSAIADLVGWYVFGDFGSGNLFAIPEDSATGVTPEILLDTSRSIVS